MDDHPETAAEIETKVYAALGLSRDLVKEIEHDDASVAVPDGDSVVAAA